MFNHWIYSSSFHVSFIALGCTVVIVSYFFCTPACIVILLSLHNCIVSSLPLLGSVQLLTALNGWHGAIVDSVLFSSLHYCWRCIVIVYCLSMLAVWKFLQWTILPVCYCWQPAITACVQLSHLCILWQCSIVVNQLTIIAVRGSLQLMLLKSYLLTMHTFYSVL